MSERSGSSHAIVFGDACLLSAGAFCATTMVLLLASKWLPDGPGFVLLDALASVVTGASVLFGPIASLLLHRRRIGWIGATGMLAGLASAGVLGMLLPLLVAFSRLIGSKGNEFAGLVATAAVAGVAFLGLTGWLVADAWRDLRADVPQGARLDRSRLVCAALVVLFAAVIGIMVLRDPAGEMGEAPIFGLVFALAGGLIALGGNVLISFRKTPPVPDGDAEVIRAS